jgi:uncharacterized protein YeaO (DUF488 family)
MKNLILKRIYDEPEEGDGYRILIDRLWSRGISKEKVHLDEWLKELAPTTQLREWFNHKEERFEEFSTRYKDELKRHSEEINHLKELTKKQQVCLLYGAKDEKHNQAVVLQSYLEAL